MRVVADIDTAAVTVVAAPPRLVSQHTVTGHLGVPRRTYLDSLVRYRAAGGEVIARGRLRLVEPDAYVAWLRVDARQADTDDDASDLADELGLRMVGGGR